MLTRCQKNDCEGEAKTSKTEMMRFTLLRLGILGSAFWLFSFGLVSIPWLLTCHPYAWMPPSIGKYSCAIHPLAWEFGPSALTPIQVLQLSAGTATNITGVLVSVWVIAEAIDFATHRLRQKS
jgi:hypothetical protein